MSADTENVEKYDFEAEVPQVMSIIINSVYSSKDLFLRELVSNAADALTKIMTTKAELDSAGYTTDPTCSYKIQIILDKINRTLTVKDNGIGMTKAQLVKYLGSIASSGTKKFREAMDKSSGDAPNVEAIIGQFGLGFYSRFLVADHIDVITKSVKDEGYLWSSDGGNSYSIRPYSTDYPHGTSVIIRLKEGEDVYLSADKITELVKKHSQYISVYTISLVTEEEEEPAKNEDAEDAAEVEGEAEVEEIKEEKTDAEVKKPRKIVEKILNTEVPVWTKKVQDIPEEDLKKFYKFLSNDHDDYAAVQSWHFEGMLDMKILLFIPKRAKFNFFEKQSAKNNNIKIINSNVFVTEDLETDIVPEWMNFVVGVVSSSDFAMNISREHLQGKAAMNLLKTKLPKCVAEMVQKLQKDGEKFKTFYKEFSTSIKLAVRQTTGTQQETFAKFLRYRTNLNPTPISLDEYLAAAPESTKQILILTGLNEKDVETSIYLDSFKDRPVLLMHEAIDEIMLQGFRSYKDFTFQRISSEGVENAVSVEDAEEFSRLKEFAMGLLKDSIERVELTARGADIPATLLTTKYANSSAMENIIKSHPGADKNPMMMMMLSSKKILEINVNNPIVKLIKDYVDAGDNERSTKYINFLYNSSLVGCGFNMDDKRRDFIRDLYEIFSEAVSKGSVLPANASEMPVATE